MPHITQVAASNIHTSDNLNIYVKPGCSITPDAQKITGISMSGCSIYVHGKVVETVTIKTALNQLLSWLNKFNNVYLVAHNGRRFDFPVLILLM